VTRHQVRLAIKERELQQATLAARPMLPVHLIYVGPRFRKQLRNIERLAASIDRQGTLLQAVVVDTHATIYPGSTEPRHKLVAGARRLTAWEKSRFRDQPIPVQYVGPKDFLAAEHDENVEREPFLPSELVDIKRAMDADGGLKEAASQRQRAGRKAVDGESGRAADKVAAVAGASRETIRKAEAVVEAAERDPDKFGHLKEQMDRTGRVDAAARRLAIMRQAEAIKAAPPSLPGRPPYPVMVVDFPYPYEIDMTQEEIDRAGRSLRPYAPMAIDAGEVFMRERIAPLLSPDCVVWFWTTNFHMRVAFDLLGALGFPRHSTIGTWRKQRRGRGQILADQTEHAIVARRGKPVIHLTTQTTDIGADWPQPRVHSRKPDEFYRFVEELCPAPRYADIFSFGGRGERWDCFGDQAQRMAEAPPEIPELRDCPPGRDATDALAYGLAGFAERLGRPEGAP
jgi:N6-adenosine-specific RNA methylase IME4